MEMFIKQKLVTAAKTQRIPGSGIDLERFSIDHPTQTKKGNTFMFLFFSLAASSLETHCFLNSEGSD